MMGYRNHAQNLEIELEMLKERIVKLEEKEKEEKEMCEETFK